MLFTRTFSNVLVFTVLALSTTVYAKPTFVMRRAGDVSSEDSASPSRPLKQYDIRSGNTPTKMRRSAPSTVAGHIEGVYGSAANAGINAVAVGRLNNGAFPNLNSGVDGLAAAGTGPTLVNLVVGNDSPATPATAATVGSIPALNGIAIVNPPTIPAHAQLYSGSDRHSTEGSPDYGLDIAAILQSGEVVGATHPIAVAAAIPEGVIGIPIGRPVTPATPNAVADTTTTPPTLVNGAITVTTDPFSDLSLSRLGVVGSHGVVSGNNVRPGHHLAFGGAVDLGHGVHVLRHDEEDEEDTQEYENYESHDEEEES